MKKYSTPSDFIEYHQDHTISETANHYGVSEYPVRRWAKECGLRKRNPIPNEQEFRALYSHLTIQELSDYYGVSTEPIIWWAKHYHLSKHMAQPSTLTTK